MGRDIQRSILNYAETVNVLRRCIPMLCILATSVWPQEARVTIPRFEDFSTTEKFESKPAPPKLVRPEDRMFRTRIRQGASKGPNFAGHYTIVEWGCGSGCLSIAVVDAKDGGIYPSPFRILWWGRPLIKYEGKFTAYEDGFQPLSYRVDSSLFIVRGCPEDSNCASYFYELTRSQLKLIRTIVAVPFTTP